MQRQRRQVGSIETMCLPIDELTCISDANPKTHISSVGTLGTREAISSAMKGEGGDVMVCVSERGEGGKELAQQEDSAWADMLEGSDYPELFSPGGCIKKDCSALSPRISHQVSSR